MGKIKEFLNRHKRVRGFLVALLLLSVFFVGFCFGYTAQVVGGTQESGRAAIRASAEGAAPTAGNTQLRTGSGIDLSKYLTANLIPYPYADGISRTVNGVTYTVNNDGSVNINGTVTKGIVTFTFSTKLNLKAGTTYFFTCPHGVLAYQEKEGASTKYLSASRFTWKEGWIFVSIYMQLNLGETENNLTVYPMLNVGEVAYPYSPPYDLIYNQGENAGHEAGKQEGYDEGYKAANDELTYVNVTQGNGNYASMHGAVALYQAGPTSLQFDTARNVADDTGLFNTPAVELKLNYAVATDSVYTITYDYLEGNVFLCFVYANTYFSIMQLSETKSKVTYTFSMPYALNEKVVISKLYLRGYKGPLGFDFDNNHQTTGGAATIKNMVLDCKYDIQAAYENGYGSGYESGYEEGETTGYETGKEQGYTTGKKDGYEVGYNEGATQQMTSSVGNFFKSIYSVFDVNIFGPIKLGHFIFIPLVLSLLLIVLKLFRG